MLPTSQKIKAALALKSISQAEIAKRVGVTRKTIHSIVAGKSKTLRYREAISRAVSVPMEIWNMLDEERATPKGSEQP